MENITGMINQNYTRPLRVTEYKACVKNIPLDMTKVRKRISFFFFKEGIAVL